MIWLWFCRRGRRRPHDPVVVAAVLLLVFTGVAVTYPWVAAGIGAFVLLAVVGALFERADGANR